ncbi:MAG: hypothetical protein LRS49_01770 [Desulfurococcales archaeon]|nr:hypothetical protein [Desulfurococcales archaeon]
MGKEIPEPVFNKFIESRVFDGDSAEDAISYVERHVGAALQGRGAVRVIRVTLYYATLTEECRFWVSRGNLAYSCTSLEPPGENLYRVHVEVLEATDIVAAFDMERVRSSGFEIRVAQPDAGEAVSVLEKLVAPPPPSGRPGGGGEPEARGSRATPGAQASPDEVFSECTSRIWVRCSASRSCRGPPGEVLERAGVIAAGGGSRYVCILKDYMGCPYLVLEIDGAKASVECVESRDAALRRVDAVVEAGGELVTS